MSDSSSRKKKGAKGEGKGAETSASSGGQEDQSYQPGAFTGARIKVVNHYAALSDDFESIEVERPLPQQRSRGQNGGAKRRAAEKFIRADYTYEYDFDESSGSKSSAKGHKKQNVVVRSDLAGLMESLTSDKLESRIVEVADAKTRFQVLVEALEQHLLRARPMVHNSNEEQWMSFNTPIGEAGEDVVEYLATFVEKELQTSDQQVTCAQYIVRRLLENTRNPTNASAGFGLRLAAQVLLRYNAWALISCFPLLKSELPKVSNVHTIPESYLDVILFIGAQLLASRDEDAPYASLAYALEILGYTALQKKNTMCIEFLARAYGRYAKAYGDSVDPSHTRLSTSVAERCLLDLSKVPTSNGSAGNVPAALKPLVPILAPLKQLILHMGLLSASEERVFVLFQKTVVLRETGLCAHTIARYTPESIQGYDQASQRSIRRLVRDLAHQLEGRNKLPPVEPELQAPIAEVVEAFHIELHADSKLSGGSPSQKRTGASKRATTGAHRSHNPRRRGSCCARIWTLIWIAILAYAGLYIWRYHISIWNKDLFHKLSKPICDATKPHIEKARDFVQPHVTTAIEAVKPHLDTALATVQPHFDTARAAAQPHVDSALAAVQPHFEAAYQASTPFLALAKEKLLLSWTLLCQLILDVYTILQPYIAQALAMGRMYAAYMGKFLDQAPSQICALYSTHIAPVINPHLQTVSDFTKPYTVPACNAISPYWKMITVELTKASAFIDKHFNVW